jgi:hypothetical protein
MTQKELAQALGITPGMVSRLAKRGMPVDSVERAQRWRKRHLEPSRIKGNRFDTSTIPTPKNKPTIGAPLDTQPHRLQLLSGAMDAALAQQPPALVDTEPLRNVLRAWPLSEPVPPMSVRVWLALVGHCIADTPKALAQSWPMQSQLMTHVQFDELVRPVAQRCGAVPQGASRGWHWVVSACDDEALRAASLAPCQELQD